MRANAIGRGNYSRPFSDSEIRAALRKDLLGSLGPGDDTLILEEVGLRHGMVRVDLAVLNGALHGYEVKSDRDSLRRLHGQVSTYNQVLDFVTLVVGERHMQKAMASVPDWWGVWLVKSASDRTAEFLTVRQPRRNPSPDKLSIAKLLWRAEALSILEHMNAAGGLRSKPRALVYRRLAETLGMDELRAMVRHQLRCRTDWRSDERPKLGDG